MDIGVPVRNFGKVDMAALGAAVMAQDEAAWNENVQRQKDYEVHEQTRSIVLLFADVEGWPAIEVSKQPGWDRLAAEAVPVMHEIIGKFYPPGGTIIRAMAAKLLAYRVFSDEAGRMNRSLADVGGQLLLVSQFTLAADTASGLRPSFSAAAAPEEAERIYLKLVDECRSRHAPGVETGRFRAHMEVSLVNDGPVTFLLRT